MHIAWHDYRDENCDIYYAKLNSSGQTLVNDTRLTNVSGSNPTLGVDASGNIHIAWYDDRDEIYYTKLNNQGQTVVDDTRLTNAGGGSYYPSLKVDAVGNVHIAHEYRDGKGEIYYIKGRTVSIPLEVGPATSEYAYISIQAAIDAASNGDTVLVHDGTYVERIDFKKKAITVRSENGAARTIINGNALGSVVTFKSGEGAGSVLDGFTITNGSGTVGGGGIYCDSSSPMLTNCIINSNSAYYGGGISCYRSSSPALTNCTVSNNSAGYYGGGIKCDDFSSPIITNCTISNNFAKVNGGGITCYNSSSPRFTNCTISGNSTNTYGGGICCIFSSSPTLTNCIISNNSAYYGGGICCTSSSSPTLTNCIISSNSAVGSGGGICCSFASSYPSSPTLTSCTISNNSASHGGGISCYVQSSPVMKNSILWGNLQEIYLNSSSITVTYSDIKMSSGVYPGSGNINRDPRFVGNGNYHLTSGSPCIDAANSDSPAPATDKDGNSRYDDPFTSNTGSGANGNYYDMGAYEHQPSLESVLKSMLDSNIFPEGNGHESLFARISNLKNGLIKPENAFDEYIKEHANPTGIREGYEISHFIDNTWGDNLVPGDSSFNTVYDASPGLDDGGVFEVISACDDYEGVATTQNKHAYYFSYDSLNDHNLGAITITQWVNYLQKVHDKYGEIGRLTIFAHGSPSKIDVSDSFVLTTDALLNDSVVRNELSRLRNILSSNAHILLFSCRVAEENTDFIQELANLTGATVHANRGYTGDSKWYNIELIGKGADWSLDAVATPDH